MQGIILYAVYRQGKKDIGKFFNVCREFNDTVNGRLCFLVESVIRKEIDSIFTVTDIKPFNEINVLLPKAQEIVIHRNQVILRSGDTEIARLGVLRDKKVISPTNTITTIAEDIIKTPTGAIMYAEAQRVQQNMVDNKKKDAKHLIYTTRIEETVEDAKKRLLEEFDDIELKDMGIDITDDSSIEKYLYDENATWHEDEKGNLPKEKLNIVAIATLGLWNGKHSAYKEYPNCSISDLMDNLGGRSIEDYDFYVQGVDLQCTQYHHDGRNYIKYRVVTNVRLWNKLKQKIYNNEKWELSELQSCTKGLGDRVRKVFGW